MDENFIKRLSRGRKNLGEWDRPSRSDVSQAEMSSPLLQGIAPFVRPEGFSIGHYCRSIFYLRGHYEGPTDS